MGGPDKIIYWGSAIVSGAGTLKVKNTKFQFGFGAIQWSGQADIESSRFTDSGWVNAFGSGTKINIVNSVFHGRPGWDDWARIRASGGAEINVSASSMSIVYSNCPPFCFTGDGALIAVTGGTINLKESALGIQLPAEPGEILRTAGGGSITADAYTWIQPVTSQSATALRTITGQPALLTDPPGLPDSVNGLFPSGVTPLLGTNVMPGVLIDAIADANPGEANELVSPINGTTITVDALGNPRVDGNGKRNIGGVQLSLAPHLNAVGTGNATVDLSWNRSLDPASGAISGYDLCYGSGTPPDPSLTTCVGGTMEVIASPDTLGTQVDSLTNGTTYWFQLRGVNVAGGGPWSNQVSGTPYGMIGTPTLAVTSTSCSAVLLEWTQPDMDGHTFAGYTVIWGLEGSGIVTGSIIIPDYDTLSTTITGLDCNAIYSFAVTASSVDGSVGGLGTSIVATPPLPPVPALDQMGLLLLTLLMLCIGMLGVRRFI